MNDRLHAPRSYCCQEGIRVVSGVADERLPSRMRQQVSRCDHLMPLTRRQRDVDRPRFRVDDDVKLC